MVFPGVVRFISATRTGSDNACGRHIARALGIHRARTGTGLLARLRGGFSRRRRWPQSRAAGCLLWIVILVVLLIVLSVLFGGFQKGTKESGLGFGGGGFGGGFHGGLTPSATAGYH